MIQQPYLKLLNPKHEHTLILHTKSLNPSRLLKCSECSNPDTSIRTPLHPQIEVSSLRIPLRGIQDPAFSNTPRFCLNQSKSISGLAVQRPPVSVSPRGRVLSPRMGTRSLPVLKSSSLRRLKAKLSGANAALRGRGVARKNGRLDFVETPCLDLFFVSPFRAAFRRVPGLLGIPPQPS